MPAYEALYILVNGGHNITSDTSCELHGGTDQENTSQCWPNWIITMETEDHGAITRQSGHRWCDR